MMGLGVPEIIVILVIVLIIFGPGKLPDIGKALGKSIKEFKNATTSTGESAEKETGIAKEEPTGAKEVLDK